ncbi:hypothetical protein JCM3775_002552 [Rhodotorula graminis]
MQQRYPTFSVATTRVPGGPLERRAVLFPPNTTFPSADNFIERCRAASEQVYGVPTHQHHDAPGELSAWCALRNEGCKYRVVALALTERWLLTERLCTWTHSHPANKAEAVPGTIYGKRAHGSIDGLNSSSGVPNVAGSIRSQLKAASPSVGPHPLPSSTTTFDSLHAAYHAFHDALAPAYTRSVHFDRKEDESTFRLSCGESSGPSLGNGNGVDCTFFIDLVIDEQSRRWYAGPSSVWQHAHGPAERAPAQEEASPALSTLQDVSPPPKRPRLAVTTPARPASSTPDTLMPTASPTPAPSQTAASTVPDEPPAAAPSSALSESATAPSGSPVPPPARSPAAEPRPDVSAFLAALNPSLVSLAPALVAAGYDSVEALASLALAQPAILDLALTEVALRAALGRSVRLDAERHASLDEVKRLAVALRAAFALEEGGRA